MENEKNLNENPAFQEQSDESLDAVAGGCGSCTPWYLFWGGDKVKFTPADNSTLYLEGVVEYGYMKTYNGKRIPHYIIHSGTTTFRDVPQHRISLA